MFLVHFLILFSVSSISSILYQFFLISVPSYITSISYQFYFISVLLYISSIFSLCISSIFLCSYLTKQLHDTQFVYLHVLGPLNEVKGRRHFNVCQNKFLLQILSLFLSLSLSLSLISSQENLSTGEPLRFLHIYLLPRLPMSRYMQFDIFKGETSVTRWGEILDFGQLFKAFGSNQFAQISHILKQFL